jgi:hypothetical protein
MQPVKVCYARPPLGSLGTVYRVGLLGQANQLTKPLTCSHQKPFGTGRAFSTTMSTNAAAPSQVPQPVPKFSAGEDEVALFQKLQALLSGTTEGSSQISEVGARRGRWILTPTGEGIERSFKFKTFAKTWVSLPLVVLW